MAITEKKPLQQIERGTLSINSTNNIIQHYCVIDHVKLTKQPREQEMGRITNRFKMRGIAKRYGMDEILSALSNGKCVIPSNVEVETKDGSPITADTPASERKLSFRSATFFALDVDDDNEVTNPSQVLESLSDMAVGVFYTFSHGIKGNRYRILFQLDRPIKDEQKLKIIMDMLSQKLRQKGIPTDEGQGKNTTLAIRPGNKGFLLNDYGVCLNADEWIMKATIEQNKRIEKRNSNFTDAIKKPATYEQIIEAAEVIGYLATGSVSRQTWVDLGMSIKSHVEIGAITDQEGFEAFSIISGPETSERDWNSFKPNGSMSIGKFFHYAKQKGYIDKGPFRYARSLEINSLATEEIKVKKHLTTPIAKELLERKQRLLIDSPTGSGKTSSFINAFKEMANSKKRHFYIFAAPTIALTEQTASNYGVTAVIGKQEHLFKRVSAKIQKGERVFVSTYDMAPALINFALNGDPLSRFTLVIDEIHKFVTDYAQSYRFKAVNELYQASLNADSFIGLSGTPSDVLTDEYDKVIRIKNGEEASPCQEFAVYTYEKAKEADSTLVHLIQTWTQKRKLLIFIQSKSRIAQLYTLLNKRGIKTSKVTSDEKRGSTYRNLIESESIADDVKVVLATSVIADGINIKNTLDWECIAVCDSGSPLFNVSTLKQISNRLRSQYRRFSVYMLEPRKKEEKLFNINAAYRYNKRIADKFVEMINSEYSGADLSLFRASTLERDYGLYVNNGQLNVNPLHLRYMASHSKELYYAKNRIAFVKALEQILHKKSSGSINISKEIRNNRLEVPEITEQLEELQTEAKEQKERKRENIGEAFNKSVYQAFVSNNEEEIKEFKRSVISTHFSCLKRLSEIADYDVCRAVVLNTTKDANTHKFHDSIVALIDIAHFNSYHRMIPTRKVFIAISEIKDYVPSAELKELLAAIQKKIKIPERDVKKVKKMFMYTHKQSGKKRTRCTKVEPITIESVAAEYGLTIEQVKTCMKNYVKTQPKPVQIAARNYYGL